jgi:hypothetical protein
MGKVISYTSRAFTAKGLNINNRVDSFKLRDYLFEEDLEKLDLLKKVNISLKRRDNTAETDEPILFYPGCGVDVLFPLLYVKILFPNLKRIQFQFVDKEDMFGLIKTLLDDIGIFFEDYKRWIQFYWEDVLVSLYFTQVDIFEMVRNVPSFDIYFERAFRIMKERDSSYEKTVFSLLKKGGILISDSGYQDFQLEKIDVSLALSMYGEMVIGIK